MRRVVVAALAGGALILGSGAAATAAPVPINIKIPNTVVIEETTANFTQLAIPLKVTCDPSFGTLSFNVLVNQGSVGGFAFVSGVTCTGKTVNVVAHPQSNFGTFFTSGRARVTVSDFANGNVFQKYVTIK